MSKLQYENGDGAVSQVGTDDVVFFINDVHPEVIHNLVSMYNEEYSISKIKRRLEEDDRVTPDEVEFLIESIEEWEKLENAAPTVESKEEEEEVPFPHNMEENIPQKKEEPAAPVEEVKKEPKKKGPKPATEKPMTRTRKLSPDEFIQQMKERIELAETLGQIKAPEIPENLSNNGRRIMLELQKEYNQLIEKYMERIQDL